MLSGFSHRKNSHSHRTSLNSICFSCISQKRTNTSPPGIHINALPVVP